MSFLNPISEPVLMFSSTDADAPKINYAARAAGDVKTVLKACLVTGYGSKASAGWTMQNETGTVAEFVPPSVAMSDYAFGVSDNSSSQTSWYYKYKGTQTNPSYNNPTKNLGSINTSDASNGWKLVVTKKGFIFIELVKSTVVNKISTRLTYFGAVKSAITDAGGINIGFFNVGHSAAIPENIYFYQNNYVHFRIEGYSALSPFAAVPFVINNISDLTPNVSQVDITSKIYLTTNTAILIGELPGLLAKVINDSSKIYDVASETFNNRPVLKICLGYNDYRSQYMYSRGRVMLIYLDNWEY